MEVEFERQVDLVRRALEPGNDALSVEEAIGQGTFGGVTKATCKATGNTWAIKRARAADSPEDKEFLLREMIAYMWLSEHDNVVKVLSVLDSNTAPALALECGSFDMLAAVTEEKLSFPEEVYCLVDIASGLAYCHGKSVVLCDLKMNNVILVHDGDRDRYVAKLADLGLACRVGEMRPAAWGTPGFVPPEAMHEITRADPSADMVSLNSIVATIAQHPKFREANAYVHQMFRTPEDNAELNRLEAVGDSDGLANKWGAISYRTMTEEGGKFFAKTITRPSLLNKMPGTAVTTMRRVIRTAGSVNPAERPSAAAVAQDLRCVASAVHRMTKRERDKSLAAAAPEQPLTPAESSTKDSTIDASPAGLPPLVSVEAGGIEDDDDDDDDIGAVYRGASFFRDLLASNNSMPENGADSAAPSSNGGGEVVMAPGASMPSLVSQEAGEIDHDDDDDDDDDDAVVMGSGASFILAPGSVASSVLEGGVGDMVLEPGAHPILAPGSAVSSLLEGGASEMIFEPGARFIPALDSALSSLLEGGAGEMALESGARLILPPGSAVSSLLEGGAGEKPLESGARLIPPPGSVVSSLLEGGAGEMAFEPDARLILPPALP